MPEITIPQQETKEDIYFFGYGKNLYRGDIKSPLVFNQINDAVQSQQLTFGYVSIGSGDGRFAVDMEDGMWLGAEKWSDAPFRVAPDGTFYATAGNITGTIVATVGTIGGFDIGADYVRDVANSMGLASTVTGGDDVRFWAGDTYANRATAPFRVTEAGVVTGSNVNITGGSVATSTFNDGLQAWTTNIVFSSTDNDTVSWTSGTITVQDTGTYAIDAGNTGNMSALTYVYLDTAVSSTILQTTTTYSTAVGDGKILIASAQNHAAGASVIPYGGQQPIINGTDQITALSIVAANIAANTITASKLSVTELSAITADMGSITAGDITVDTAGYIRGGQTAYHTGTGFFLGYSGAAYKFSIGNPSGNYLTWDGSTLTVKGVLDASTKTVISLTAGESLSAGQPVYVESSTETDFSQTTNNQTDNLGTAGTERIAQSFTTTDVVYIDEVTVRIFKSGSPSDSVRVGIQASSGGNPSGTFLASADLAASSIDTSATNYTFTFSTLVPIPAGVEHFIVMQRTGATDPTDKYNYRENTAGGYAGGKRYQYNGAAWSSDASIDIYFSVSVITMSSRVFRCDASYADFTTGFIGFATASATAGNTTNIQIAGIVSGLSSLSVGQPYYLSDTVAAISTTPGTVSKKVGISTSSTELLIVQT